MGPSRFLAGFGLGLLLCACAATVEVKLQCLPLVEYSPVQNTQILAAYHALPDGSVLRLVVKDYLALRDADRACLAGAR